MGDSSATVWHVCESGDEVVTHAKTLLGCRRAVAAALGVDTTKIIITQDQGTGATDDWTVHYQGSDGPPNPTGYTLIHRTNIGDPVDG